MRPHLRLNCISFCFLCSLCVASTLDVITVCHRRCITQGVVADDAFDVVCNEACKIEKCFNGCQKWKTAINSSCQEICKTTDSVSKPWSLYCTIGCNFGITAYIQLLKDVIGTPPPPYLVAGSSTNDSVTIEWQPGEYANITYLVQWKNADSHSTDWEYYNSHHLLHDNVLQIKGLHPYTKYRFRVAWILLPHYTPLVSEESFVISTTSYGVPSSAPKITSLTVVGSTRVSVTWNRPTFPNGEIVSYALSLREHLTGNVQIKYKNVTFKLQDVSDSQGQLHYMFANLKPQTTYIISIAANNNAGRGPADDRNITTPAKVESTKFQVSKPYLLFATPWRIARQAVLDIVGETKIICQSSKNSTIITGVAFHMKEEKIFLSDSVGSVHVVPMYGERIMQPILQYNSSYPTLLSMDWLNDKLYMIENKQISRCSLDGNYYKVVVEGLHTQPSDLHVDPYHGYLYWVISGKERGGLYRLDLNDINFRTSAQREALLIKRSHDLQAFVIDHMNFRILYPDKLENTVFSVSLDGADMIDIRHNSQNPRFSNVKSLTMHNNLFYWTNGTKIFGEEYHQKENKYYYNHYLQEGPFITLKIMHADSQPYPVPLNPVENLQALFKDEMAKIFWSKPKLLEDVGKGAWQQWFYEVHLYDHTKNLTIFGNNTSVTIYKIFTLTPNTTYSVKVRPYSPGGKGTWSNVFTGKTLVQNKMVDRPFIIWGTKEGIVKSDIVGENTKLLLHKANLNNAGVIDIRCYKDQLFINTNTSSIYVYNMSKPHSLARLENVSNAVGIALDWLAPKLYWSRPSQQMICRSNLDGSQLESLLIETLAQKLAIDSPFGHLYWSTTHSVEGSYLNGSYIHKYVETGLFSGRRVMGLALDFDKQKVYWMIRNYEGALVYRAPLLRTIRKHSKDIVEFVGSLLQDDIQGPLWYFNSRLFWIHQTKGALVSDMQGKNIAGYEELQLNNLQWFAVIHNSLQSYPARKGTDAINVIPNHIQESDIKTEGSWNNFSIIWPAVTNVNYGEVFYDIDLHSSEITLSEVSREPRFVFPIRNVMPYTEFTIAVRTFTVWASSKQTVVNLFSPMSYPSQPERPRIFVVHKLVPLSSSKEIDAEFRWSIPLQPNGVILGYRIMCWYTEDGKNITACDNVDVDGSVMKFPLYNLLPNRIYSFQVKAYTMFGEGPYSATVETITSHEQPVPKLLLAKIDAVKVTDLDTEEEHLLSIKAIAPIAITYLARENKVFWLEKQGSLMTSQTDGYNTSLVHTLSSTGTSLAIDWIGRYLYWTESNDHQSSIWMLDLNSNNQPYPIFSQSAIIITAIEVEPFSSKLIWSEMQENGQGHLKTSDSRGKNVHLFFHQDSNEYYYNLAKPESQSNDKPYKEFCNCLPQQLVGKVIAIDRSNITHPEVLWVDGRYGHLWASDMKGCTCHVVVNATENKDNGLPPTSITVDTTTIYWSNKNLDRIYSVDKESQPYTFHPEPHLYFDKPLSASQRRNHLKVKYMQGIRQICAIGDHLQAYPDKRCLYPLSNGIPVLINKTPNSLKLQLPAILSQKNCSKISMPTIQYFVYYAKNNSVNKTECNKDIAQCKVLTAFAQNSGHNEIVTITGLQPFTSYISQVAVSNYYNKGKSTLGPVNIFQTKEGVPYAPANVSVACITPERIDVYWDPPNVLNGKAVKYEARWKIAGEQSISHSSGYPHKSNGLSSNRYTMSLENLLPETRYYVVVRAYSLEENLHNDSTEVTVATYGLPHNMTLIGANAKSLNLSWLSPASGIIIHHTLEMCELSGSEWHRVVSGETSNKTLYNFTIIDLQPKTTYKARLILTYSQAEASFVWPRNSYFTFQTLGGRPDTPGIPHVRNIGRDSYQVVWTAAFPNGGEVIYNLEYSIFEEPNFSDEDWKIVYNGSNTHWLVEDLPPKIHYQFRVQAVNDYGKSDYSNSSEPIALFNSIALASQANGEVTIILISTLSTILFIASFLGVICYLMYRKHQKEKQIPHTVEQEYQNPDTELATLRELPLNGNFVHQNNALYSIGDIPTDEELASLPHIHREQIIVTKFLGSGAFGEVFEGIAHNLYEENESPIKVAIKTLRKGATGQEKAEFLKEAKLMSNFKHEHILQLLGVCLNNNPNFIILELMEGGDLLTYLRSNRPSIFTSNPLTLDDLIAICVDVAKGCHCLEEMHFVHRDLAARNCLVSSHDRSTRIVKIGDFGLARDIYKNDYYRKEGEGLLPVRWMAPESLVDGVFTSQSDVWAFGVLLWEVMTLGQQPYPARTNLEVLHYVRTGGRLDKPQNCPDDLHQLMILCWSYCPEGRPTFEYCLETLKELRRKSNTAHVDSVHNHNYLGHFHNGNRCRNGERDLDTWSTCSDPLQACRDVGNINKVKRASSVNHPPLQKVHLDIASPGHITQEVLWQPNNFQPPKYLEILADTEDITDADGYEMPLPPLPSSRKRQMKKSLQYAELARLKSPSPCPSTRVDSVFPHVTDADSLSDLLNLSYAPVCPKFILDFVDNKENIDNVNGIDRFYESGSECLHSPIITSALLKPKSSQNLNVSEQKLNSSGQDMDRWSVSTVSTVPCPNDINSDFDSFNHSGISSLSEVSGVELNYIPNSSWC